MVCVSYGQEVARNLPDQTEFAIKHHIRNWRASLSNVLGPSDCLGQLPFPLKPRGSNWRLATLRRSPVRCIANSLGAGGWAIRGVSDRCRRLARLSSGVKGAGVEVFSALPW